MKGLVTALVTPFSRGEVDFPSLKKLLRHQLDQGIDGLVVNGTTAESPTLKASEVEKIFKFVKSECAGQIPLILGTGGNATEETCAKTRQAEDLGATAALVVVPYYNKPPQRGLVAHFRAVAQSTDLPILVYNVPSRTVASLTAASVLELAKEKNIVGIKEATGDMKLDQEILKGKPKDFFVTSGDDATFLQLALLGGEGVISVISNLTVAPLKKLFERARKGDKSAENEYQKIYSGLLKALYIESNPIPVKWALHRMGIISSPELRLPLSAMDEKYFSLMEESLGALGLA